MTVAVLARAHGGLADVGRSANVVLVNTLFARTVQPGDVLLATMRQSEGEWFILDELIAGNPGNYEADSGERDVDLPADFSVLSSRANAIIDDHATECPNDMREVATDAQFATTIRTPDCPSGSADDEEDLLQDAEHVPRANNDQSGSDAGSGDAGR